METPKYYKKKTMNPVLTIKNNTGTDIPISIFSNGAIAAGALNSGRQFQWNLKGEMFIGATGVSIQVRKGSTGDYQVFTFTGNVTTPQLLIEALNSLEVGSFNTISSGTNVFINTWNSTFEYGQLTVINTPVQIYSVSSLVLWAMAFKTGTTWHKFSDAQQQVIFAYYFECTSFYLRLDYYNGATFISSSQVKLVNNAEQGFIKTLMTEPVTQTIDTIKVMMSPNGVNAFTQLGFDIPFPNWTLGTSAIVAGIVPLNAGFLFGTCSQQLLSQSALGEVLDEFLDVTPVEILTTKSLFPAATDPLVDVNPVTGITPPGDIDLGALGPFSIQVNLTGHTGGTPDVYFIYGWNRLQAKDQNGTVIIDVLELLGLDGIGGVCCFNP